MIQIVHEYGTYSTLSRLLLTETMNAEVYILYPVKAYLIRGLRDGIKKGTLCITDHNESYIFGEFTEGSYNAKIHVQRTAFWTRIFMGYDLGCKSILHDYFTLNV